MRFNKRCVISSYFFLFKLEWVLAFAIHNPMRLIIADYNHPVLITEETVDNEMKLVVVDGLHRLVKAKMYGLVEIPGKLIELEKLNLI